MTSQARNTDIGTGVPTPAGRSSDANVDSLAAGDARRLDTLRARIPLADAAGHEARACRLRAELALCEEAARQTHRTTTTGPTTPSPTGSGRMSTVDQVESPKPSHRRVGERKLRHVRVDTELWVLACKKAEAEGVKISEVVRRLLESYVRDEGPGTLI